MSRKLLAFAFVVLLLISGVAVGQNVSSSVKGVVADPSGAVVSGANLTFTNQGTQATFNATSDKTGSFTFLNVLAGTYNLRIEAHGFSTKTISGIIVEASQIRTLGNLNLEVGATTSEVNVTADAAAIQLASAEKAGTVTGGQLDMLALKGRDMFALLGTLPGVVDTKTDRVISTPDQVTGTYINGSRDSSKNFTVDGITNLDTGSNQTSHYTVASDAIQEVRVLTSNYQAEFGRSSGGAITVITKSGTSNFHGTGYHMYRNESLNAQSWNNKFNGINAKDIERARVDGFTLGGPIYIPGKFNKDKTKLFFFWSEEFSSWLQPSGNKIITVPTEAERNGDFSKSVDASGNKLYIKDPNKAGVCSSKDQTACFAGNIIPQDRWSSVGQKLLSFFPSPNYTPPSNLSPWMGNYQSGYSGAYDRRSDMVRVDANISDSLSAYFRFNHDKDQRNQPFGNWVTSMNYVLTDIPFNQPGYGYTAHVTKTFSPTLVNEVTYGKSHNHLTAVPGDIDKWQRSQVGLPQLFGDDNYLPNISFGTRYSSVGINVIGSFPYDNTNDIYSVTDNLSKVYKNHSFRTGIYFERTGKLSPLWTTYRGSYSFAHSTLNPLSTQDAFSNALLGVVNSYSESTKGGSGDWWFNNIEWYLQDNWRLSSRLTLDFGVRFYHMSPVTDNNGTMSTVDLSRWNAADAPRLYQPALQNGVRVGYDPVTNTYVNRAGVGAMVPGSGNFDNGTCVAGKNGCPVGLAEYSAIDIGPRFGLAYDVFGNGKTALHLGGGIFKDRGSILPAVYASGSAPINYTSNVYYTTLDQLVSAGGYRFPNGGSWTSGGWAFSGRMKTPTTTNYSLGVQQQLPGKVVLDVSYVGGISRHLWIDRELNPIKKGALLDPANKDYSGAWLSSDFLRVYRGYTTVTGQEYTGTSNYNALQVTANRAFSNGLQFGVSYSWAKAMGLISNDGEAVSSYLNPRDYNYGELAINRPQSLVINYYYDLPKPGKKTGSRVLGWITDGWNVSGVTSFIGGAPTMPTFGWSTINGLSVGSITGSSDGARPMLVGDPHKNIPEGMQFNPAAFAPIISTVAPFPISSSYAGVVNTPTSVNFGNTPVGILRAPGTNNTDLTVGRRINLGGEKRYLMLKAEAFNVFNHTQYSGYNASITFVPELTNGALTGYHILGTGPGETAKQLGTLGQYTSARSPRKMQLSVKLYF